MNELTLKNGLKLYFEKLPYTHSLSVDLCVRAGTKYENDDEEGITHFLEHMHFRWLKDYTQQELYYFMESIGTTLRAVTYKDFLRFYIKIHPLYFDKALCIFKSILETVKWPEFEIEKEKNVVLNEIYEKDGVDIDELSSSYYFKGSRLEKSILGSEETVKSFSSEQISAHKQAFFNTDNMAIFVSGPIENKHLVILENMLGEINLSAGNRFYSNQKPKRFKKRSPDIVLVQSDWDFIDVDISVDVDIDNIALYEIDVLNCILGEGVGSRLQCLIREKLCYVYDISSVVEKFEEMCILHIRFSVQKHLLYRCLEAIVNVLNEMKTKLDFKDLDTTLPFFNENISFSLDDPQETNFINEYNLFVLDRTDFKCMFGNSVNTINRLMNISDMLFKPQNISVVCLGGCEDIKKIRIKCIIQALNRLCEE